jgi:hypothetical protein
LNYLRDIFNLIIGGNDDKFTVLHRGQSLKVRFTLHF